MPLLALYAGGGMSSSHSPTKRMTDTLTIQQRSALMSRVRGVNTEPERLVRSYIHRQGFRFRLHARTLPSKPDIVLPKYKTVIFVHGCFWHGHRGCKRGKLPRSHVSFWRKKIAYNRLRDYKAQRALKRLGWNVLVVWECDTKDDKKLQRRLFPLLNLRASAEFADALLAAPAKE